MSRDPLLYLEDILDACDKIRTYVQGETQESLEEDAMRFDAVVRNLELIGEAARQLPKPIHDAIPRVPWREIIAMRNILVHGYFGIDPDVVWTVATGKIDPLADAIKEYLGQHEH